jgi:hypothetical protein
MPVRRQDVPVKTPAPGEEVKTPAPERYRKIRAIIDWLCGNKNAQPGKIPDGLSGNCKEENDD